MLLQQQLCPRSTLGHSTDTQPRRPWLTLPGSPEEQPGLSRHTGEGNVLPARTRNRGRCRSGFALDAASSAPALFLGRELGQCLFHFNHQVPK